jgi:hypothetical protein
MFNQLAGLLQQYTSGQAPAADQVNQHFDQVAAAVPASSLAQGLADAFRSDQTPPFAQMAAQLFANSGAEHQSNLLNTLMASAGPAVLSGFMSGNAGSMLSGLLAGGQNITPEQAAQVPPEEVQALAEHVHQNNPSVIDRVGEIYSEHPTLIKSLGAVALGIALKNIGSRAQA